MSEEQKDMLFHGLDWMGVIKIKVRKDKINLDPWNRLRRLIG